LVVAISLFKSITFASTNNNDVIYVTSAFFQNLCPIVSIYEDIGLATAGLGNGTPYLQYQRYVQGDIIKALRRNGIKAFPDMTSSDFQIIQNFECFSEIEEFIKSERPIFHAKKTLVPVIDTSLIQLSSTKLP
jgi:hypothetical protein